MPTDYDVIDRQGPWIVSSKFVGPDSSPVLIAVVWGSDCSPRDHNTFKGNSAIVCRLPVLDEQLPPRKEQAKRCDKDRCNRDGSCHAGEPVGIAARSQAESRTG